MNSSAKKVNLINSFDYESLDEEQRFIIQQRTGEIRDRLRRSAQDIWEIGQKLADVRSRLRHGQFDVWLKAEFGWSRRTAYNFISVYETFAERANLSQVDIATSALYLLAAPSTSQKVRDEFLQKAKVGQTVTHKELRKTIQQEKSQSPDIVEESELPPVSLEPEIVRILSSSNTQPKQLERESLQHEDSHSSARTAKTVLPWEPPQSTASTSSSQFIIEITPAASAVVPSLSTQPKLERQSLQRVEPPQSPASTTSRPHQSMIEVTPTASAVSSLKIAEIQPGWYLLDKQHLLFYGDTASDQFTQKITYASLAIAITNDDWDHDWLIERAKRIIIFPESDLNLRNIGQLVDMFSSPRETVVFPWLPNAELLIVAHQLQRKIYAGDSNQERCYRAITQLGLPVERLNS